MNAAHIRVALKLAELAGADRDWMLERLDADTRDSVSMILQRLTQAGLRPSGLSDHGGPVGNSCREQSASLKLVRKAKADLVAPLLAQEPYWVSCLIFRIEHWPWLDSVIGHLPEEYRTALAECLRRTEAPLAPRLKDTMVELLAAALEAESERRASSSRFERILAHVESQSDNNAA